MQKSSLKYCPECQAVKIYKTYNPKRKYCSRSCANRNRFKKRTLDIVLANATQDQKGCLVWNGRKNADGYGSVKFKNKESLVHRLSWSFHNKQDIPKDLCVIHSCDNPPCINPQHLRIATQQENIRDMDIKGRRVLPPSIRPYMKKKNCKNGHLLEIRSGRPICKICQRAASRRFYFQKMREAI